MIKALIVLFALATVSIAWVPCGQCLGQGQECGLSLRGAGTCKNGLECRVLAHGSSAHCWKKLEVDDPCDITINNGVSGPSCPSNARCEPDTQKCTRNQMSSAIHDGCFTDDDCLANQGLNPGTAKCEKNICKSDATCDLIGCPINQYCDLDKKECIDKPVAGDSCTATGALVGYDCWKSTCISDVCRPLFSAIEGADCTSNFDCEPGLECTFDLENFESKCKQPILEVLKKNERVRWGADCDPLVDQTGCQCHYGLNVYKFLIEANPSSNAGCKAPISAFYECVKTAKCYDIELTENSCLRRNCLAIYRSAFANCFGGHPSLVPDTCSAGTFSLVVLFVFLAVLFN